MDQNKNKATWPALVGARERDEDGTKRMPALNREELLKQSEPSTDLIDYDKLLRLQAHTRLPEMSALDPLNEDLPVLSPIQPPAYVFPAQVAPPPAPTEVPPPLATSLLSETLLNQIQMQDELEHGGKNSLPVLASRFSVSAGVKGSSKVAASITEQVAADSIALNVREQREPSDVPAGMPEHDKMLRSAHIGFEQLRALQQRQEQASPPLRAWIWMLLAAFFGMALMALWLGRM